MRIRGVLDVRIYEAGELVEHWRGENLVVDSGLDTLAAALAGGGDPVTHVALGTSDTAADPGDTTITEPYTKALAAPSYPAPGEVVWAWEIGPDEAVGLQISEFGLVTTGGALVARKVRSEPINKSDATSLSASWSLTFSAGGA